MSMPERYSFHHTLGVDLIEIADAVGNKYIPLNMVDIMGTCFQLCGDPRWNGPSFSCPMLGGTAEALVELGGMSDPGCM